MDYISSKEASEKWGIGKARVNKLAKEGRIKGAILVGKYWLIPSDANKPSDQRLSTSNDDNNTFKFPIYTNYQVNDKAFLNSLNSEEKKLLEGQVLFTEAKYEESYMIIEEVLNTTTNIYLKIGALYYLCQACIAINKAQEFRIYLNQLRSLFKEDFPYKKDLEPLLIDIESCYLGNQYFFDNFDFLYDYQYHPTSVAFLKISLVFIEAVKSQSANIPFNEYNYVLDAQVFENEHYDYIAQLIYLYLSFAKRDNHEQTLYYLRKATEIGIKINSYHVLGSFYPYLRQLYNEIKDDFDDEIINKIHDLGISLQENASAFIGSSNSSAKEVNDLNDEQFNLMNYALKRLSNKEVAEIMNIPEYTIRRKYVKLLDRYNVQNKKKLGEIFLEIVTDGYRQAE